MSISYDEIRSDSRSIALALASSNGSVPSFFAPLRWLKYHLSVYFIFAFLSFFLPDMSGDYLIGLGVLAFGLMNWLFIFAFSTGYANILAMIDNHKVKDLSLVKILSRKVRVYGAFWLCILFALGIVSVTSELSIGALVFGNFVFSILGLFIFNIDISRYQISGLLGALGAVKESLK